jgi:hypothetical protein
LPSIDRNHGSAYSARLKLGLIAAAVCMASTPCLFAPPTASARSCGRVGGVKIHAYNLSCRKARSIFGSQPPKGWTAGNLDVAGGVAFYCHADDEEAVIKAINKHTGRVRPRRLHGAPLVIASEPYGDGLRRIQTAPSHAREMRALHYRSCVSSEPALAMVAFLHHVSLRTACRVTKRIVSHPWPESDRVKITRWCWNDLGKVSSFEGWNVKVRGFDGPATLRRGGRWFAFLGQEFPISCV